MNRFVFLALIYTIMTPLSCYAQSSVTFDIEGHRGCRGLMPENTLPAFQKALELGVNTLELDLAVSADRKLVVSHEPYFSSVISITPDGNNISKQDELKHNMFQMPYDSIRRYDVGTKSDPRFPDRANVPAYRPLLSEVFDLALAYSNKNGTTLVDFNIEIKRLPAYDGIYHPDAAEFSQLLLDQIYLYGLEKKCIIQSFDPESLRQVKKRNQTVQVALLIENDKTAAENIAELGFVPEIYSCAFVLVNEELISFAHSKKMRVIPWTVNKEEDIRKMIELGVDGIISDYPDRVISILNN